MTEHGLWRFSRALHQALTDKRFDQIETVLDENVDWSMYGPIDMFPFFGARHGKDDVLDVMKQIAEVVKLHRFDREAVMLGESSAASLIRYTLTPRRLERPISVRVAHFAQFKGSRLVNLRAIVDTFDLVEQALGRQIHLPKIA